MMQVQQRLKRKPLTRTLEEALGSYRTPPGKGVDDLIEEALSRRAEEIKNIA